MRSFTGVATAPGLAGSMIDFAALEAAAQSRPTTGWAQRPVIYRNHKHLRRTLAGASFVKSARRGGLG